jgi:antitoxin ParD1/3/4
MAITISKSLESWVQEQAALRGFASAAEYVQHVLQREREEQRRQQRKSIERKLLEALDSGEPVEATPEFWEQRRQELRKRLAGKRKADKT